MLLQSLFSKMRADVRKCFPLGIAVLIASAMCGGCSTATGQVSPAAAAFASLNVDSLCTEPCPVVAVDSGVRSAEALLAYYPFQLAPVSYVPPTSLVAPQGKRVLGIAQWPDSGPGADTALVAFYSVGKPLSNAEQLIGVAVVSPGRPLRTFAVRVRRENGRWHAYDSHLFFEP